MYMIIIIILKQWEGEGSRREPAPQEETPALLPHTVPHCIVAVLLIHIFYGGIYFTLPQSAETLSEHRRRTSTSAPPRLALAFCLHYGLMKCHIFAQLFAVIGKSFRIFRRGLFQYMAHLHWLLLLLIAINIDTRHYIICII